MLNGVLLTMPRMIDDQRVIGRRRVARDAADRRQVVIVEAAAERVGQQLLR